MVCGCVLVLCLCVVFFFKQKTAYDMRISDWSSDVCSSDLGFVRSGFIIRPDLTEVAEVFEVPLSFLMDPSHHFLHRANLPDGGHRFYFSMPWNDYFI